MNFLQRCQQAYRVFRQLPNDTQSPEKDILTTQSSQQQIWALTRRSDNLSSTTRDEIKKNPYVYAALRNTADEVVGRWNGAAGYIPSDPYDPNEVHLSRPPQILAASQLPSHQAQAEHLRWNIDHKLKRGWDTVIRALLHAREDGKTILELIWQWEPSGRYKGFWIIDDILHCDPDAFNFTYNKTTDPQTQQVQYLKQMYYNPSGGTGGTLCPPGKFVVYSFDKAYENDEGNSILNKLNLYDWYQRNNFIFWLVDLNRYGSPLLVGKVPKGAKQTQRDALLNAIASVQQETGIVLDQDEVLEILQAQRNGAPGFELLNRIINAIISVVITGNAMSLESTQQGSYALAKATTAEMRSVIFNCLATEIDNIISHQLIYWWMTYNYPITQEHPKHQLLYPKHEQNSDRITEQYPDRTQSTMTFGANRPSIQFSESNDAGIDTEEQLVLHAAEESLPIFKSVWIDPILSILEESTPETLLQHLDEFTPNTESYIDILTRAMVTADILARWRIQQEIFPDKSLQSQQLQSNTSSKKFEEVFSQPMLLEIAQSKKFQGNVSDSRFEELLSQPVLLETAKELMLSKQLMSKDDFERLVDRMRRKAFTISGQEDERIQAAVRQVIAEAIADGITEGPKLTFLAVQTFERYGIDWRTHYHAETVFRTNIQSAIGDAQWQIIGEPAYQNEIAFYEYVTKDDHAVRPNHAEMHGIIRPPRDPVWLIWWTPNGYNCRCRIKIITKREAEQRNIIPSPSLPNVSPDPGFTSGPGY